jgi:hypothetical protein
MFALPEKIFIKDNISVYMKYKMFYFSPGNPNKIIDNSQGIIMLHNTWTPYKYKKMSEEEFLKQNILLAHLLRKILRNKKS